MLRSPPKITTSAPAEVCLRGGNRSTVRNWSFGFNTHLSEKIDIHWSKQIVADGVNPAKIKQRHSTEQTAAAPRPEPLCEAGKSPSLCSTPHAAKNEYTGIRSTDKWSITENTMQAGLRTDVMKPYMSQIDIGSQVANAQDGHTNSFSPEPVSMVSLWMKNELIEASRQKSLLKVADIVK